MPTPLPGSFKATLKRSSGQAPTVCAQNDAQLPHRWYHRRLPDTLSSQSVRAPNTSSSSMLCLP